MRTPMLTTGLALAAGATILWWRGRRSRASELSRPPSPVTTPLGGMQRVTRRLPA